MERGRRERCVRVTLVVQDARRRHDKTSVAASRLQLLRNESHGLTPVATGMSPLRGSVRKRLRRAFSRLQVSKLQGEKIVTWHTFRKCRAEGASLQSREAAELR